MDVFVLGATGELGRPAVRDMISAGHRVRAVTRTDAKATLLGDMGADPVVLENVFDRDALARAASGADALLHLATRIPPTREMRKPAAWAENNRLRSDLTPLLVDVALEREIGVLVADAHAGTDDLRVEPTREAAVARDQQQSHVRLGLVL